MALSQIAAKALASEWLRALRGQRTQQAFSRRLGYRSNIAYRWEAGRAYPSASRTFEIIASLSGHVSASLTKFYRAEPPWLSQAESSPRLIVARLLDDLRGKTPIAELARRTGYSRFALARWIQGRADPTLVEFLVMLDHASHRLLDFISSFTDPEELPSVRNEWQLLRLAREAAYEQPWSHAILRALELDAYRTLECHQPGWLARRLGIDEGLERACLTVLEQTRQIAWANDHYVPTNSLVVDTRQDPKRALELRAGWARVGLERLRGGAAGLLAYNLSSISRVDLARIERLQRAHHRELVNIIAESSPAECVVLYSAQLLELSEAHSSRASK
jgi:hypothetical protein